MRRPSRRDVLVSSGASLTAAVSGCLGRVTGRGSTMEMTVQGVEVRSSPGEQLPVRPSDRVALLDFWATWCAPCKPQMAELRSIREQFPEVHMLSITNESDVEAVKSFWREYEGTWPVAIDPDLRTNEQFGVNRIPTLLLFGRDGDRVWEHVGLAAADSIAEKLREAGA